MNVAVLSSALFSDICQIVTKVREDAVTNSVLAALKQLLIQISESFHVCVPETCQITAVCVIVHVEF